MQQEHDPLQKHDIPQKEWPTPDDECPREPNTGNFPVPFPAPNDAPVPSYEPPGVLIAPDPWRGPTDDNDDENGG